MQATISGPSIGDGGPDGPWVAQRGDVVILCARLPHALLVVGQDDQLVLSAASALGVL
jgi:hypothetical protein